MERPLSPALERIVSAARAGEPRGVLHFGSLVRGNLRLLERVFCADAKVLSDPTVKGPRLRREVFPPLIPFSGEEALRRGLDADDACASVRACPPMERAFQLEALGHMASLDRRLYVDETLDATARRKIERELQLLAAPGRPIWQNWVNMTPREQHARFDTIIHRWLASPVDLAEEAFFVDNWRERHWSVTAAGAFFAQFDHRVCAFLGIRLRHDETVEGIGFSVALLEAEPRQFNCWAEMIELKLHIGDPVSTPSSASESTATSTTRRAWVAA